MPIVGIARFEDQFLVCLRAGFGEMLALAGAAGRFERSPHAV